MNIKELKKRGLQLRAIKDLIPQITASMSGFVFGHVELDELVHQNHVTGGKKWAAIR